MKQLRLTEDVRWEGFIVLRRGQPVFEMNPKQASRDLTEDEILICTDPVALSCQTILQRRQVSIPD